MRRRALVGAGIVALWLGGVGALARRELFQGETAALAHAALFVAPGAEYYAVSRGGSQVGFGSSTIDTTTRSIRITDLVVADTGEGAGVRRLAARVQVETSRTLRLRSFRYQVSGGASAITVTGRVEGDSVLALTVASGATGADRSRVALHEPLLLPTMVPMAIALGRRPSVGATYTYQVFDPFTRTTGPATVRVEAESLFVLPDSARRDAGGGAWVAAHRDTVRAWRVEQAGGGPITGWIDERGRMVQARPLGILEMRRTAYELAFDNWSRRMRARPPAQSREGAPSAGATHSATSR